MIAIGSPNKSIIKKTFDNQTIEEIKFCIDHEEGLFLIFNHDATDDVTAKSIAKRRIGSIAELQGMYWSVKLVDEDGRIL